jgi:hypothetical protein
MDAVFRASVFHVSVARAYRMELSMPGYCTPGLHSLQRFSASLLSLVDVDVLTCTKQLTFKFRVNAPPPLYRIPHARGCPYLVLMFSLTPTLCLTD